MLPMTKKIQRLQTIYGVSLPELVKLPRGTLPWMLAQADTLALIAPLQEEAVQGGALHVRVLCVDAVARLVEVQMLWKPQTSEWGLVSWVMSGKQYADFILDEDDLVRAACASEHSRAAPRSPFDRATDDAESTPTARWSFVREYARRLDYVTGIAFAPPPAPPPRFNATVVHEPAVKPAAPTAEDARIVVGVDHAATKPRTVDAARLAWAIFCNRHWAEAGRRGEAEWTDVVLGCPECGFDDPCERHSPAVLDARRRAALLVMWQRDEKARRVAEALADRLVEILDEVPLPEEPSR